MSRFLLVVAALLGKNRAMYASQVKQMLGAIKTKIITQSGSTGDRRRYIGIEWLKKIRQFRTNEDNTGAIQFCGDLSGLIEELKLYY